MDRYTAVKIILNEIIRSLEPKAVYIYGSLAVGDYDEYSDIDFVVATDKGNDSLNGVKQTILNQDIPYKFDVLLYDSSFFVHDLNIFHCIYSERKEYRFILDFVRFGQRLEAVDATCFDIDYMLGSLKLTFHYYSRLVEQYSTLTGYFAFDYFERFQKKYLLDASFAANYSNFTHNLLNYEYMLYSKHDVKRRFLYFVEFFKKSIPVFESVIKDDLNVPDIKDYLFSMQHPSMSYKNLYGVSEIKELKHDPDIR